MVKLTVNGPQSPQSDKQPGYLGYFIEAAIEFCAEINADPKQVNSGIAETMFSPVDSWE